MEKAIIWETCARIFRETFGDNQLSIGPETTANDIDGMGLAHACSAARYSGKSIWHAFQHGGNGRSS